MSIKSQTKQSDITRRLWAFIIAVIGFVALIFASIAMHGNTFIPQQYAQRISWSAICLMAGGLILFFADIRIELMAAIIALAIALLWYIT